MSVALLLLTSADAPLLERVAPDVFDEPVRPDLLSAYLAEPGHLMIVALEAEVVVGQCAAVIHRHPDKVTELYVDELAVAPSHQRRGIGRALMDAMLAEGRARGCLEAWLGTEPDNGTANGLYAGLGASAEPFNLYSFDLGGAGA